MNKKLCWEFSNLFIYLVFFSRKLAPLTSVWELGATEPRKQTDDVKRGLGEDREQVCESRLKFSSNFENTAVTQAKRNIIHYVYSFSSYNSQLRASVNGGIALISGKSSCSLLWFTFSLMTICVNAIVYINFILQVMNFERHKIRW